MTRTMCCDGQKALDTAYGAARCAWLSFASIVLIPAHIARNAALAVLLPCNCEGDGPCMAPYHMAAHVPITWVLLLCAGMSGCVVYGPWTTHLVQEAAADARLHTQSDVAVDAWRAWTGGKRAAFYAAAAPQGQMQAACMQYPLAPSAVLTTAQQDPPYASLQTMGLYDAVRDSVGGGVMALNGGTAAWTAELHAPRAATPAPRAPSLPWVDAPLHQGVALRVAFVEQYRGIGACSAALAAGAAIRVAVPRVVYVQTAEPLPGTRGARTDGAHAYTFVPRAVCLPVTPRPLDGAMALQYGTTCAAPALHSALTSSPNSAVRRAVQDAVPSVWSLCLEEHRAWNATTGTWGAPMALAGYPGPLCADGVEHVRVTAFPAAAPFTAVQQAAAAGSAKLHAVYNTSAHVAALCILCIATGVLYIMASQCAVCEFAVAQRRVAHDLRESWHDYSLCAAPLAVWCPWQCCGPCDEFAYSYSYETFIVRVAQKHKTRVEEARAAERTAAAAREAERRAAAVAATQAQRAAVGSAPTPSVTASAQAVAPTRPTSPAVAPTRPAPTVASTRSASAVIRPSATASDAATARAPPLPCDTACPPSATSDTNEADSAAARPSALCIICMDAMHDKDARTLECGHVFHATCINRWLRQPLTSCPICRG